MSETKRVTTNPFRRAVLRGLGIIMAPLLTVILFLYAWDVFNQNVLVRVESASRWLMVWRMSDIQDEPPSNATVMDWPVGEGKVLRAFQDSSGRTYVQVSQGRYIPQQVFEKVNKDPGDVPLASANAYYDRYIRIHWLKRTVVVPVFFCVFILILYILGKFFAAGMGRMIWNGMESLIQRLPLISNVYSSVKQITDFMFSESDIEFTRVVAVEYPRKGIWSIGFVTGESMLDIRAAANEAVLSVLMPTSPMPATGFTVTVLKSETIDLDLSIDQALQFVVSCGVVVPRQQQQAVSEISSRIAAAIGEQTANVVDAGKLTHHGDAENNKSSGEKNNGSTNARGNSDKSDKADQHSDHDGDDGA